MLKQLGTFAILAACLFAMLISGCPDGAQEIVQPLIEDQGTVPPGTVPPVLIYTGDTSWITSEAAKAEAETTRNLLRAAGISARVTEDEDSVREWMLQTASDNRVNVLILYGILPPSLYPNGNTQPDGSVAEQWIETSDGNTLLNHADYLGFNRFANRERALQNLMDIPGIRIPLIDYRHLPMDVTATGVALTPSLVDFGSDRPLPLSQLQGGWVAEKVLASHTSVDGEVWADPVVVRDGNRGRIALLHQTQDQDNPKGEVAAELIINYLLADTGTMPPITRPPVTQQRFTGTLTVPDDTELQGLAWNPQGTMLAAGYWGDAPELGVWLYDTATGEYLKNLKGEFSDGVHQVAWGSALFIGTDNWDVQMWDPATGQHLRTVTNENHDFAISPDSRILAVNDEDEILLIDIGTGQVLRTISEEYEWEWFDFDGSSLGKRISYWLYSAVAFSPDSSTIALGVWRQEPDLTFQLHSYDVATGRKKLASPDLGDYVRQVAWNSDGSRIAARVSTWITLLDAATGEEIVPADDAVGDASAIQFVENIAWHPTAPNILAVGGSRGTIELMDIAALQILKTLTHGDDVDYLAFSPDGKTLASGDESPPSIRLWDVSDVR